MRRGVFLLVLAIGISPRFPLPLEIPGRQFELRFEDVILVGLVLNWLLTLRPRIHATPLFRAIAFYTVIITLTTALGLITGTVTPSRSLPFLFKELEYFLIFFLVANWVRTHAQLQTITRVILAVAAANAVWAAVQTFLGTRQTLFVMLADYLPLDVSQGPMVLGSYGPGLIGEMSPFSTGGFFMLVLLLTFGFLLFAATGWRKKLLAGLGVTFAICLFLTESRANVISALIGVGLLALLAGRASLGKIRLVLLLAAVSVGALVGMAKTGIYDVSDRWLLENIQYSATQREEDIWWPLLAAGAGHPLFGFGKGALDFAPGLGSTEAHNQYLRVFVESGVVGLAAFLGLLGSIALLSARAYRNARFGITRAVSTTALAATVALVISAFYGDVFVPVVVNELWWVLVALAVVAQRIEGQLAHPREVGAPQLA